MPLQIPFKAPRFSMPIVDVARGLNAKCDCPALLNFLAGFVRVSAEAAFSIRAIVSQIVVPQPRIHGNQLPSRKLDRPSGG
jgi:hypothetical protein